MDPVTEAIIISKIRDGIFVGDFKAGSNEDLLNQFKISHLINVSGKPLPYNIKETGIKYLSLNIPETPEENNNNIISDSQISEIVSFIDDSYKNGEGLFGFSLNGKNRICVIIILYLMKKFKWPLKKCYDYVSTKKKDIEINNSYKNYLKEIEKEIFGEDNIIDDEKLFWNDEGITDENELIMKNTYMNEVQDYELRKNNFFEEKSRYRIIRHVEWGDNKKFAKQMVQPGLVHYNIDKDLFLKKGIEDIDIHSMNKPLRSCIKSNLNLSLSLNIASTVKKRKKEKIILEAENNNISIEPTIEEIGTQRSINNDNSNNNTNTNTNNNKNQKKKKNIFENVLPKKRKEKEQENDINEINANINNNKPEIAEDNALSIEKIEDIDDLDCEDELQVNNDINIPPKSVNIDSPININPRHDKEFNSENKNPNIINNSNNKKLMPYTNDLSPISIREENESVKISNKDLYKIKSFKRKQRYII